MFVVLLTNQQGTHILALAQQYHEARQLLQLWLWDRPQTNSVGTILGPQRKPV